MKARLLFWKLLKFENLTDLDLTEVKVAILNDFTVDI